MGMVILAFGITLNTKTGLGVLLQIPVALIVSQLLNLFDIGCIVLSVTLGLICRGKLIGIGLGTIVAMVGVGRAVALFHVILWKPMMQLSGLEPEHLVKMNEE